MNSNLIWVHRAETKITIHALFITVHSTVHALKNIKNGSHSTIHTFKNYFATVLSVFSFSNNKLNPNGPIAFSTHEIQYLILILKYERATFYPRAKIYIVSLPLTSPILSTKIKTLQLPMLGKIFPNNEERQTQHIIGCSAVSWERHCRAYVLELEPSSKATNLVS